MGNGTLMPLSPLSNNPSAVVGGGVGRSGRAGQHKILQRNVGGVAEQRGALLHGVREAAEERRGAGGADTKVRAGLPDVRVVRPAQHAAEAGRDAGASPPPAGRSWSSNSQTGSSGKKCTW